MKKILTIGLSFVIMSNLYASGDHQGDHMHEGKMTNHSNSNGMTNEQMRKMSLNEKVANHEHN